MCWLKRGIWKAGIAIAGMLLLPVLCTWLLALVVWIPVSAAGAQERASGLATPVIAGMVQATPTQDATVTALNKEKLEQEIQQLKNQNAPDIFGWLRTNAAILLSTLVVVIGGLIGLFRWFGDRRSEREKRAEERFQSAVTGLGDEKEGAKIGAAILLRTFLRPGYEQFYTQTFDLAVANLCPTGTSNPPADPNAPLLLTTLRQALIAVFKEAFPLARERVKKRRTSQRIKALLQSKRIEEWSGLQSLDATYIQLDNAYLSEADLKQVWMPQASLREANLSRADLHRGHLSGALLRGADLHGADLTKTDLTEADLSGAELNGAHLTETHLFRADLSTAHLSWADLSEANLSEAKLTKAILSGAKLTKANLSEADLNEADLSEVNLTKAILSGAKLTKAILSGADLSEADLSEVNLSEADLSWVKLENVQSLEKTDLRGVKGLTKEQLEACQAKGAIIDEDTIVSSSLSPVAPSPPLQSNNVQASLAPHSQVNTPIPDTDGSSTTSSKLGSES